MLFFFWVCFILGCLTTLSLLFSGIGASRALGHGAAHALTGAGHPHAPHPSPLHNLGSRIAHAAAKHSHPPRLPGAHAPHPPPHPAAHHGHPRLPHLRVPHAPHAPAAPGLPGGGVAPSPTGVSLPSPAAVPVIHLDPIVAASRVHDSDLGRLMMLLDRADPATISAHADLATAARWRVARAEVADIVQLPLINAFSLAAFQTCLGAVGLGLHYTMPGLAGVLILGSAVGSSVVVTLLLWRILNAWLKVIDVDSTPSVAELEGRLAEATHNIGAHKFGQIAYEVRGSRMTAPARNVSDTPIPQGSKVRLGLSEQHVYLIEPLSAADVEFLAILAEVDETLGR